VDGAKLSRDFVGRRFDRAFLADLPPDVDACGENGEFHTFVFDGPLFRRPAPFRTGEPYARAVGGRTLFYQPLACISATGSSR
jgi:diphthamide synthase (EF-2-diphthine--ammonia ligase)